MSPCLVPAFSRFRNRPELSGSQEGEPFCARSIVSGRAAPVAVSMIRSVEFSEPAGEVP